VRQSVKSYNKRWSSSFHTLEIEEDEVTKIKILSCARQNGLICIGARGEAQARVRNESSHAYMHWCRGFATALCLWCNCAACIMAKSGVDGISHTHLLALSHDLAQ